MTNSDFVITLNTAGKQVQYIGLLDFDIHVLGLITKGPAVAIDKALKLSGILTNLGEYTRLLSTSITHMSCNIGSTRAVKISNDSLATLQKFCREEPLTGAFLWQLLTQVEQEQELYVTPEQARIQSNPLEYEIVIRDTENYRAVQEKEKTKQEEERTKQEENKRYAIEAQENTAQKQEDTKQLQIQQRERTKQIDKEGQSQAKIAYHQSLADRCREKEESVREKIRAETRKQELIDAAEAREFERMKWSHSIGRPLEVQVPVAATPKRQYKRQKRETSETVATKGRKKAVPL